jgi:hypothetical protein
MMLCTELLLDGFRERRWPAVHRCPDLELDPTPTIGRAITFTLKSEYEMMAAVTVGLGMIDVILVISNLMRETLKAFSDQGVHTADVIHNSAAAAQILHLIELARMPTQFSTD